MKALFIRKLHLWPRFEACAKEVLDAVDMEIEVLQQTLPLNPPSAAGNPAQADFHDIDEVAALL